jgi:hypothetical protein
VAPAVRKPPASLQRSAVKVKFAADRGDLEDIEAEQIADRVLSYLSDTERSSLTSRGDRFHVVPDLARFKREGLTYLRYANHEITPREFLETPIAPAANQPDRALTARGSPDTETSVAPAVDQPDQALTARESPDTQTPSASAVNQPDHGTSIKQAVDQPVIKREPSEFSSEELYRDDGRRPGLLFSASAAQPEEDIVIAPAEKPSAPALTRKRGPNRSWEDHRADQSWESSFEESSSSSSSSSDGVTDSPPPVSHTPIGNPTPAPIPEPFTPPRQVSPSLLFTPTGRLPSPLQVLFLHHSPINPSPQRAPSATDPATSPHHTPSYLTSPPAKSSTLDIDDVLEHLLNVESTAVPAAAIDRSVSLQDPPTRTTTSPAVPQRDYVQLPPSPVDQARGLDPETGSFWNDYDPGTPSPKAFRYNVPTPSPVTSVDTAVLKTLATMEALLKDFLDNQALREAARDQEMADLKASIVALASPAGNQQTAADRARAAAQATLEAEKVQKMTALEEELRPKWEAAGLSFTPLANPRPPPTDKAENPKADLIGILNPLPSHVKWTGQSMDANGHYLSFSVWLRHVKQVLDQKESLVWKKAVLDMASLTCLRGRALHWWHGMLPEQQEELRLDFSLEMWDTLGKALHRNEQVLKREARDRKREFGETLAEYAWQKTAMLQEAFGRNREVADLISDIKDGLSPTDQEAIRTDLQATPTLNKLMAELVRLDTI